MTLKAVMDPIPQVTFTFGDKTKTDVKVCNKTKISIQLLIH